MTLWSSYTALTPRTRLFFGLGIMVNAALALTFSDQIESVLDLAPTKEEEAELKQKMPKIMTMDKP